MFKDFFEKLSKKEKTLLFITLGLVSLMLLDAFVLGPILSRSSIMDAEIQAKEQTIKRNLRIISFRDSIEAEYAGYQSYLDSADKVREEIIGDLLRKIEVIAKKQSIGIINIQPGDIIENPVFQEYKTSLECEGAFADVLGFMRDLEESEFLFKITRYSMTPKSKGGEVIVCQMDISRVFITEEERSATPPPFLAGMTSPKKKTATSASSSMSSLKLKISGEAETTPMKPGDQDDESEDLEDSMVLSTEDFLP